MYVNTTAEVKAETDYCCTSANAVQVVEHIYREHGQDTEILFGPDMWLGAYVERTTGKRMHVWDGECHVHAGIRPADITAVRNAHPDAEFIPRIDAAELLRMQLPTLPIEPVVLELLTRAKLAKRIRIVNGLVPGNLTRALAGEAIGTLISA